MASWFSKQTLDLPSLEEFDAHRMVSFVFDDKTGLSGVIAIHRTNKGIPSFGATRLWHYASETDGICDALRLSRLMSYKAALAGLPCGGAKAIIFERPEFKDPAKRTAALKAYADRVNLLGTSFVTGTDVGISQDDLKTMRDHCPQIIGFNDNTTEFTGLGVFESVKAALEEAFGSPDPAGRSFAIQGLGKVGTALLENLAPAGAAKIYVSDVNAARVEEIRKRFPQVEAVAPDVIHLQEADVFSPCALNGAVSPKTVAQLKAKVVAGGANNQLSSEQVGDTLFARGIVYAPDYVANAGGIIAIYDEYEHPGHYDELDVRRKVMHIPGVLKSIFEESKASNRAPHRVANGMAERIFNTYA